MSLFAGEARHQYRQIKDDDAQAEKEQKGAFLAGAQTA